MAKPWPTLLIPFRLLVQHHAAAVEPPALDFSTAKRPTLDVEEPSLLHLQLDMCCVTEQLKTTVALQGPVPPNSLAWDSVSPVARHRSTGGFPHIAMSGLPCPVPSSFPQKLRART